MTRLLKQTEFFKQRKLISVCHNTSEYNLDDPDYLPPFWKYKVILRKDGRTEKQYLSPHGVTVRSFVAVTQYLLACSQLGLGDGGYEGGRVGGYEGGRDGGYEGARDGGYGGGRDGGYEGGRDGGYGVGEY